LGRIGLDNEIDGAPVGGAKVRRSDDGYERSSGSDERGRPFLYVAADDIEHQVNAANVFQQIAAEIDEFMGAEVEGLLASALGRKRSSDDRDQRTVGRVRNSDGYDLRAHLQDAASSQPLPCGAGRSARACQSTPDARGAVLFSKRPP
jgi:hypothetical protein